MGAGAVVFGQDESGNSIAGLRHEALCARCAEEAPKRTSGIGDSGTKAGLIDLVERPEVLRCVRTQRVVVRVLCERQARGLLGALEFENDG
jgi:hypothetical protein